MINDDRTMNDDSLIHTLNKSDKPNLEEVLYQGMTTVQSDSYGIESPLLLNIF